MGHDTDLNNVEIWYILFYDIRNFQATRQRVSKETELCPKFRVTNVLSTSMALAQSLGGHSLGN